MAKITIPTFDALMNPLIHAIQRLGGSGTIEEISNNVAAIADYLTSNLKYCTTLTKAARQKSNTD